MGKERGKGRVEWERQKVGKERGKGRRKRIDNKDVEKRGM